MNYVVLIEWSKVKIDKILIILIEVVKPKKYNDPQKIFSDTKTCGMWKQTFFPMIFLTMVSNVINWLNSYTKSKTIYKLMTQDNLSIKNQNNCKMINSR